MTLKNIIKYIKWCFSIGYFERCDNWKSDYLELLLSVYVYQHRVFKQLKAIAAMNEPL